MGAERIAGAETATDTEVEVIRENGQVYYRIPGQQELTLLTPKDQPSAEDGSIADWLPLAPPRYDGEPLAHAEYEVNVKITGKGNPHDIMRLANPSYQAAPVAPTPRYASEPISNSRSYLQVDPTPTLPYTPIHTGAPRNANDDTSTQPLTLPDARAVEVTTAAQSIRPERIRKVGADRRVIIGGMVGAAVLAVIINFATGDSIGKAAADYCAKNGLADLGSSTGCAVGYEAHTLLPFLPEPHRG